MSTTYDLQEKKCRCRVTRKCIWCGEMVYAGELEHLHQYKMDETDDLLHTDHFHPECWDAATKFFWDSYADTFTANIHKRGSTELQEGKYEE
jgi:hypothetical protein